MTNVYLVRSSETALPCIVPDAATAKNLARYYKDIYGYARIQRPANTAAFVEAANEFIAASERVPANDSELIQQDQMRSNAVKLLELSVA